MRSTCCATKVPWGFLLPIRFTKEIREQLACGISAIAVESFSMFRSELSGQTIEVAVLLFASPILLWQGTFRNAK